MSKPSSDENQKIERRAKRVWVGIIVGLLSMQVIGGVVTVMLATGDPTQAVIPNYYQAGLDWDIKHRNLDQFVELGWQLEMTVQTADVETQTRQLKIRLTKNNDPVLKQRVSASIYHHARGADVQKIVFDEGHEGEYVATTRLTQAGLWGVDVVVEGAHGVAESRFTTLINSASVSQHVEKAGPKTSEDSGT